MPFTLDEIKKIAHLARLGLSETDEARYMPQLSRIVHFIEQLQQADTVAIEPLSHPFDFSQRLRSDVVAEPNLREHYQKIAPQVEAGLYLVPTVIEEA